MTLLFTNGSENLSTLLKVSRQNMAELCQAQMCLSPKPILYPGQIRGSQDHLLIEHLTELRNIDLLDH